MNLTLRGIQSKMKSKSTLKTITNIGMTFITLGVAILIMAAVSKVVNPADQFWRPIIYLSLMLSVFRIWYFLLKTYLECRAGEKDDSE